MLLKRSLGGEHGIIEFAQASVKGKGLKRQLTERIAGRGDTLFRQDIGGIGEIEICT